MTPSHPMDPGTGLLRGWTETPDPQSRLDARGRELVEQIAALAKVDGRVQDAGRQLAAMLTGFCPSGGVPNYLYHSFSRGVYVAREERPDDPEDALLARIVVRGDLADMYSDQAYSLARRRKIEVNWYRGDMTDNRARFAGNWWQE